MLKMQRPQIIGAIWKLTIASFIFVQVMGVIVISTIIVSNDRSIPKYQALMAYGVFIVFSGCLFFAAKAVKRMVDNMYHS
jgi:FtsH-binding integral membrane protein